MTNLRFLLPLIVLLLTTITTTIGHHLDFNKPIPEDLQDRLLSGSTNGPMSTYFQQNLTAKKSLEAMNRHMQDVERRLQLLISQQRPYGLGSDDTVCNRKQRFASTAVRVKLTSLSLPPTNERCITELDLKLKPNEQAQLWNDRIQFLSASKQAGLATVQQLNRTNWEGQAYTHAEFIYTDHIDSCTLLHNVGFRIRGKWSTMVSVSQFPMSLQRRDRYREYQVEYLTIENGTVGNILVTLPHPNTGNPVSNTTTTLENWRGTPASSIFRQVAELSENPAIATALQTKGEWREQVEDARSPSNVSIMILTCLLTLVPLASFADVTMIEMVIYTLATDIVSCIPLSIKGIELLSANRRHSTTVIWAYGNLAANRDTSLIVESWSASCKAKDDVRNTGTGLLVFALFLMTLGVILELWARSRLMRRKNRLNTRRLREENERLKQSWTAETPCQLCSCYGRISAQLSAQQDNRLLHFPP